MHAFLVNFFFGVVAAYGAEDSESFTFSRDSHNPDDVIYRDVSIIGVIEPKAQLGGHAETHVDLSGWTVDIGVVVFEPLQLTTDYFARFGIPLVPLSTVPFSPAESINFDTGETVDWEPPSQEEIGLAFAAYGEQLSKHPDVVTGYDLNYPVDEDTHYIN
ncbi:hypothetical protein diail_8695 [Diaporthe ilicicola]|nr:hypothetical protein diail_8695 [Diaporthe ilicicola]